MLMRDSQSSMQHRSSCTCGPQRRVLAARPQAWPQTCPTCSLLPAPRTARPAVVVCQGRRLIAATCAGTVERALQRSPSQSGNGNWPGAGQQPSPSASGSRNLEWSQVDTAAAAAAVWRQQQPGAAADTSQRLWQRDGGAAQDSGRQTAAAPSDRHSWGAGPAADLSPVDLGRLRINGDSSAGGTEADAAALQAAAERAAERRRINWRTDPSLSDDEKARRERIGASNRGRVPWNKGLGEVRVFARLRTTCKLPYALAIDSLQLILHVHHLSRTALAASLSRSSPCMQRVRKTPVASASLLHE